MKCRVGHSSHGIATDRNRSNVFKAVCVPSNADCPETSAQNTIQTVQQPQMKCHPWIIKMGHIWLVYLLYIKGFLLSPTSQSKQAMWPRRPWTLMAPENNRDWTHPWGTWRASFNHGPCFLSPDDYRFSHRPTTRPISKMDPCRLTWSLPYYKK